MYHQQLVKGSPSQHIHAQRKSLLLQNSKGQAASGLEKTAGDLNISTASGTRAMEKDSPDTMERDAGVKRNNSLTRELRGTVTSKRLGPAAVQRRSTPSPHTGGVALASTTPNADKNMQHRRSTNECIVLPELTVGGAVVNSTNEGNTSSAPSQSTAAAADVTFALNPKTAPHTQARGYSFAGGLAMSNPRTLRIRQRMRTSYDSRLAALESAEEEQRQRLAAPYTRRIEKRAAGITASTDDGDSDEFPKESAVHRQRRESQMNSAFVNPFDNSYYAYFQSGQGDTEALGKAMGLPPQEVRRRTISKNSNESETDDTSASGGQVPTPARNASTSPEQIDSVRGKGAGHATPPRRSGATEKKSQPRPFTSHNDKQLASEYISKLPRWKQKEIRHSRYLLTTLHPESAALYVKYQKVYDRMLAEDKAFERDRKAFLDKGRQ